MRKVIAATAITFALATPAIAADLRPIASKAPAAIAPNPFNWTGFYVGVQLGYQWSDDSSLTVTTTDIPPAAPLLGFPAIFTSPMEMEGVVGGLHAGFNWQVGQFLLGLEGDFEGSLVDGAANGVSFRTPPPPGVPVAVALFSTQVEQNWQASVRGRVGFVWDRVLLYATGGVSFGDFDFNIVETGATVFPQGTVSDTLVGYTVGGGIEWASWNNWTARLEYRYTDYDDFSGSLVNTPLAVGGVPILTSTFVVDDLSFHTVRAGISYKFGGPTPVVARY